MLLLSDQLTHIPGSSYVVRHAVSMKKKTLSFIVFMLSAADVFMVVEDNDDEQSQWALQR